MSPELWNETQLLTLFTDLSSSANRIRLESVEPLPG